MQNDRMQIMQAKDLQAWANEAKVWHYGDKILNTAMDVGMVLTGSIELKAAWVAAGKVTAEVVSKEVLEQAGKTVVTDALKDAGEQTARAAFRDTVSKMLRSGAFYKALWQGGFYGLGGLGRQAIVNTGDAVGGRFGDPSFGEHIELGRNIELHDGRPDMEQYLHWGCRQEGTWSGTSRQGREGGQDISRCRNHAEMGKECVQVDALGAWLVADWRGC